MRKYSTDARHDIGSLNWRDRAKERKRRAKELNDTLAAYCRFYWRVRTGDLALEPYGIRLIPNAPVFHIYEDWPGLDRRKVSGSVWDGRKPIWRTPSVRDYPHKPGKLTNGPKVRCAHRSWKSAKQVSAASSKPVPHPAASAAPYAPAPAARGTNGAMRRTPQYPPGTAFPTPLRPINAPSA